MTWLALSLNEWRRRPLRTAVTAAGVAIGVAALFSLLSFENGYRAGLEGELDRLGAHVLVVPKGCPYDAASIALHGASWPCYLKARYLDEVQATPGVACAAPVFMAALQDREAAEQLPVYVGVETNLLALKRSWKIAGRFAEQQFELLAGAHVADRYHWQIGQQVELPGLPGVRGTVSGVLRPTHGADDSFLFLRLADAQEIFRHPKELTHILVRLTDPDRLDQVVSGLRGCGAGLDMNVIPLAHLFRTIQSLVRATRVWLGSVALVGLLAAGAGVSNTLLMAVAERTREIGVMRALGASRGDIFRLLLSETLWTCGIGAGVGLLVAQAAARGIESWVRAQLPFAPTDTLLRWEWWVAALCLGVAAGVGSVAAMLPAWQAARLPPMEAIRSQGGRS